MTKTPDHCLRIEFEDGSSFEVTLPAAKLKLTVTRPTYGADVSLADRFLAGSRYAGGKVLFAAYGEEQPERRLPLPALAA
jgi:hypothetical protein